MGQCHFYELLTYVKLLQQSKTVINPQSTNHNAADDTLENTNIFFSEK